MDKFKALSLVLLGMVLGLGYAVACGSGGGDTQSMSDEMMPGGMNLPGVSVAMAQSACANWEMVKVNWGELEQAGKLASATGTTETDTIFRAPAGWTPWAPVLDNDAWWFYRCAQ